MRDSHDQKAKSTDRALEGQYDAAYWQERTSYRKFGDYAAGLAGTTRWYRAFVRAIHRHLPHDGRHLDVGCGHGAIVHLMLEHGLDSYGFDASEWMIEQANAFRGAIPSRFAVGDATVGVPFDGDFDLITCLEVLEHLIDPARTIELLVERLRPRGKLIFTTPNPVNVVPRNDPVKADPTHVSVDVPERWCARLSDAGLAVVESFTYIPVPLVWRVSGRASWWVRMRRDMGTGFLAVARR